MFDDHKQNFETPMGFPLSPVTADMVMTDLEESILDNIDFPIKFVYRYIDDIVATSPL